VLERSQAKVNPGRNPPFLLLHNLPLGLYHRSKRSTSQPQPPLSLPPPSPSVLLRAKEPPPLKTFYPFAPFSLLSHFAVFNLLSRFQRQQRQQAEKEDGFSFSAFLEKKPSAARKSCRRNLCLPLQAGVSYSPRTHRTDCETSLFLSLSSSSS